jgi:hypothetical protein
MRINSLIKYRARIVLTTAQRFEALRKAMQYEMKMKNAA